MNTKRLPQFQGKPLIEIPQNIQSVNFLEGDFGQAVLEEYQSRVARDYNNAQPLQVLAHRDNVVTGSNPFAAVLVNQIIREEGLHVATPADLEEILKRNVLPLQEQYEDAALVLRSEDEPNTYLAQILMRQIKARNSKAKSPMMIPLSELELVTDVKSKYGLVFQLRDDANIFYDLPILQRNGSFVSEDVDAEIGLPTKLGKGDRNFYGGKRGLSGLYLLRNLLLYTRSEYLADSDVGGRVVVVKSGEATAKTFSKEVERARKNYVAQLKTIRASIDQELSTQ